MKILRNLTENLLRKIAKICILPTEKKRKIKEKAEPLTNGLASCGVYARGKFSGNLKVLRPCELLCSPARTPSRQPLAASGESAAR